MYIYIYIVYLYTRVYMHTELYMFCYPRPHMTLVLIGKDLVSEGLRRKIRGHIMYAQEKPQVFFSL